MIKYIKLDDAIKKVEEHILPDFRGKVKAILSDLPTIDIVHCKDCKYFKLHESVFGKGWICKRNHVVVGSVDFCSYGERIDNE